MYLIQTKTKLFIMSDVVYDFSLPELPEKEIPEFKRVESNGIPWEDRKFVLTALYTHTPCEFVKLCVQAFGHEYFSRIMGVIGFIVTHPLYKTPGQVANMSSDKADEYQGLVESFKANLVSNGILDVSSLQGDDSDIMCSVMIIKYRDGMSSEIFWTNTARSFRGTSFFCHPDTHDVTCLSSKLQRGAECVTDEQKKEGITGENWVSTDSTDKFHPLQRKTMEALLNEIFGAGQGSSTDPPVGGYATTKVDGSMFVVTTYTGYRQLIMKTIVDVYGSPLVKAFVRMSLEMSGGKYMFVPATQGTVLLSTVLNISPMETYMVDAILSTYVSRDDLISEHDNGATHVDLFEKYGGDFIQDVLNFVPDVCNGSAIGSTTLIFEALVANTTDLFFNCGGGRTHRELAMKYDFSRIYFLGASYVTNDGMFYVPHMLCDDTYVYGWHEPLWWDMTNSTFPVSDILKGMGRIIRTDDANYASILADFIARFPPSNPGFNVDDVGIKNVVIHLEGLVLMTVVPDATFVVDDVQIPFTDYGKAKTSEYYLVHKFYLKYVQRYIDLYEYDTARRSFPLISRIHAVYDLDVLRTNLTSAFTDLLTSIYNNIDAHVSSVTGPKAKAFAKCDGDGPLMNKVLMITDAVYSNLVAFFGHFPTANYDTINRGHSGDPNLAYDNTNRVLVKYVKTVRNIIKKFGLIDAFISGGGTGIADVFSTVTSDDKRLKDFMSIIGNFPVVS